MLGCALAQTRPIVVNLTKLSINYAEDKIEHETERRVASSSGSGCSLYSGGGPALDIVGQENACPRQGPSSCLGPHDDGLEQSAYGLFHAILVAAGMEAPDGAPLPPTVDET
jgi:hypothetical protein